jgi:8-oxo-dGTP pyrophosphatase MutT (NUDIX family)
VIAHDEQLRDAIRDRLTRHERRVCVDSSLKRAAVAIVVVASEPGVDPYDPGAFSEEEMSSVPGDTAGFDGSVSGVSGGAAFLLCRRAARMNRHAGQWALPGGRMDDGETAVGTALRELHEELGLRLDDSAVLGVLDDLPTRSGYVMTPVVMWCDSVDEMRPDPGEVAHVYSIGLHELLRADAPRFVTIQESQRPVVQLPIGRDLIHAPTGAVLLQFRWVGLDGHVGARVDHLEQPTFAWR